MQNMSGFDWPFLHCKLEVIVRTPITLSANKQLARHVTVFLLDDPVTARARNVISTEVM
jgi:hypothetical protein